MIQKSFEEKLAEAIKNMEAEMGMDLFPNTATSAQMDKLINSVPNSCFHEWLPYYGLKESYQYCKKCDLKSPLEEK